MFSIEPDQFVLRYEQLAGMLLGEHVVARRGKGTP